MGWATKQKTTFSEIPHVEQLLATLRSSKHDIAAHLRRCSEYIGAMMKSSTNPKGSESNFNWQGEAPQWFLSTHDYYSWLVVDLPLWNILIWKSIEIMTSQYMEKCSKPPTCYYRIQMDTKGISWYIPPVYPEVSPWKGCHRMFFPMKCVISPKKKWGYPMGSKRCIHWSLRFLHIQPSTMASLLCIKGLCRAPKRKTGPKSGWYLAQEVSNQAPDLTLKFCKPCCLTGWWYTYPSEKCEFVSWDDYSQSMKKK